MYCIKCRKRISGHTVSCPCCGSRGRPQGITLNIYPSCHSRYKKVLICGREKEITVFDGYFQTLLTEHQKSPVTGIAVGHHDIKLNSGFKCECITSYDAIHERYVMGITYSSSFYISEKDSILTDKAVKAFMQNTAGRANAMWQNTARAIILRGWWFL